MNQSFPHPMSSLFSRPVWQPSISPLRSNVEPGTIVAFRVSSKRTAERFTHPSCKAARHSIQNLQSNIYLGLINTSVLHKPLTQAEERANGGHGRHEIQIAPIGLVAPTAFFLKDSDYLDVDLLPETKNFEDLCAPLDPYGPDETPEHSADTTPSNGHLKSGNSNRMREPLRTTKQFPWRGASIYTTININGVVGEIHGGAQVDTAAFEARWRLGDEELARFDDMADKDDTVVYEARMKSSHKPRPNTTLSYCGSRDCTCNGPNECIAHGMEIASDQLVLDLWLDLNVAGKVRDPHEFHKEWLHLNRIVQSCYWQDPRDTDEALPEESKPEKETTFSRLTLSWNDLSGLTRWGISAAGIGLSACGLGVVGKMVLH